MAAATSGLIHAQEAYSKRMVLERLGISQKFWDKMLDEGLPYTNVGHTKFVTGQDLIEHLHRNAERRTT
ncbi:MAG: topoisomerase II [Planctomycetaceae bacterium]